jgi:transcription elongation factor GreA
MENKSYHLTPEGFKRYKEEYKRLKQILRENRSKIKDIRDDLWRPEDLNSDYEPMESELISIEIRLKELENIIKNAKIIKKSKKTSPKIVTIGTTVIVEVDGQIDEFTIVDTLEANPAVGKISNESPVGRALLGYHVGDEIVVSSPIKTVYRIKKIRSFSS